MSDLATDVRGVLERNRASETAIRLWDDIYSQYDQNGPDAVLELLEKRVAAVRKAARAEASEMRAAAGSVKRKGRSKRRGRL
jgi:hypothetical protein